MAYAPFVEKKWKAGTPNDLEVFFIIACLVWYSRNQVVHEGKCLPSSQIWGYAQRLLGDYNGAMTACGQHPLLECAKLTLMEQRRRVVCCQVWE